MVFIPGMDPSLNAAALQLNGGGGNSGGIGGNGVAAMDDLQTQTHSLESLDILAAADVDTFSVGNSPPGTRNKGGGGGGSGGDDDGGGLFSTAHMSGPLSTAI
jgi:hypothetical protein